MDEKLATNVQEFASIIADVPELRYAGDPVLRRATSVVTLEEGVQVAEQLKRVLRRYRSITGLGRGLAAPQIGECVSVFVTYVDDVWTTYINPVIVERSPETNFYRELCMSVGLLAADVERSESIVMRWMNAEGHEHEERYDGFIARLLQHEEAHLRGVLNIDEAAPCGIECATFDPLQEKLRKKQS